MIPYNNVVCTMEIRPMSVTDYDIIIALWERAGLPFKPLGRDNREKISIEIMKNPDLVLGAYKGNELIGMILGTDDGRKGWINRLAVLPENRRQGVANALIAACEEALGKRGRKIICTLVEDNPESLELFNKAGYIKHDDIFYLSKREDEDV
jgi:ribosomal protein S18 acetylase RimI-like enzyme